MKKLIAAITLALVHTFYGAQVYLTFDEFQQIVPKKTTIAVDVGDGTGMSVLVLGNGEIKGQMYVLQPVPSFSDFKAAYPNAVLVTNIAPNYD
jgi:hypothetical protein